MKLQQQTHYEHCATSNKYNLRDKTYIHWNALLLKLSFFYWKIYGKGGAEDAYQKKRDCY